MDKQTRNFVYILALERLDDEIAHTPMLTFVCPTLYDICMDENIPCSTIEVDFPEFYEQKPKGVIYHGSWWDTDAKGNQLRRSALVKAIELTEE